MAKPVREILNDLLAILRDMEATVAWRRFEQLERPGGVTPMGVFPDDTGEDFDTLSGRFSAQFADAKLRLGNRRPSGLSDEECLTLRRTLGQLGETFAGLCRPFSGRSSGGL